MNFIGGSMQNQKIPQNNGRADYS